MNPAPYSLPSKSSYLPGIVLVHELTLDKLQKGIYYYVMGTVISPDGLFEWDEEKNIVKIRPCPCGRLTKLN